MGIFINIISGMKIAIAFFGIPRCSKKSYPSIKEQIIEHLPPGAKTKCFYHFYEQKEVVNARSGEEGELDQTNYVYFEKFAGILEKPDDAFKKTPFEKAKKFGNAWSRDIEDFSTLRNLLLQLRSLKKVTKLVESFEPDCVFFVRPDLLYHEPIPDYYYNLSKNSINSIFVPGWQWGAGINDDSGIGIYRQLAELSEWSVRSIRWSVATSAISLYVGISKCRSSYGGGWFVLARSFGASGIECATGIIGHRDDPCLRELNVKTRSAQDAFS
mgnify:CR=1 FL=1